MLQLREGFANNQNNNGSAELEHCVDLGDEDPLSHDDISAKFEDLRSCPLEAGELQVISLGMSLQHISALYIDGQLLYLCGSYLFSTLSHFMGGRACSCCSAQHRLL